MKSVYSRLAWLSLAAPRELQMKLHVDLLRQEEAMAKSMRARVCVDACRENRQKPPCSNGRALASQHADGNDGDPTAIPHAGGPFAYGTASPRTPRKGGCHMRYTGRGADV